MDILFFLHLLNGLLMVGMPIGLAIYLTNHWKLGGLIWWIGAATFIISQVGHIPFNWIVGKLLNQTAMVSWNPTSQLIFNAVFLGVSAGIFEEGARYLILRWWAKDARSWRKGVLFGAGHGGAEAILFGGVALYAFFQRTALRSADLSKLFPANQLVLAQNQVQAYWSMTWYASMQGALERFFTIPCQIAMALLVMQVFTRKKNRLAICCDWISYFNRWGGGFWAKIYQPVGVGRCGGHFCHFERHHHLPIAPTRTSRGDPAFYACANCSDA